MFRAANARGWSETVWSGSGSGCSAVYPKPSWQTDPLCATGMEADTSPVADPNCGAAVYGPASSAASGWLEFGGSSVSSPLTAAVYGLRRILIGRYPPPSERGMQTKVAHALLSAPAIPLKQAVDWLGAATFSAKALKEALSSYSDGPPYAPLAVPVVVIQGAEDIHTPTSLAAEYVEAIAPPAQRFVSLAGGGHMALVAMPDAFLQALLAQAGRLACFT